MQTQISKSQGRGWQFLLETGSTLDTYVCKLIGGGRYLLSEVQ